jgi:hypothetical protein
MVAMVWGLSALELSFQLHRPAGRVLVIFSSSSTVAGPCDGLRSVAMAGGSGQGEEGVRTTESQLGPQRVGVQRPARARSGMGTEVSTRVHEGRRGSDLPVSPTQQTLPRRSQYHAGAENRKALTLTLPRPPIASPVPVSPTGKGPLHSHSCIWVMLISPGSCQGEFPSASWPCWLLLRTSHCAHPMRERALLRERRP